MTEHSPCDCTARLNEAIATWGAQVAVHPGRDGAPDRPLMLVYDLTGQHLPGARIAAAFCAFCGVRLRPADQAPHVVLGEGDASNSAALPEIALVWAHLGQTARVGGQS